MTKFMLIYEMRNGNKSVNNPVTYFLQVIRKRLYRIFYLFYIYTIIISIYCKFSAYHFDF